MAELATLEDFTARHGEVAESDEDRVTTLLADASALVLSEASMEEDWEPSGEEVPDVVVMVVVGAAYRAWRNPLGIERESLGASSVTYADASDGVWLTKRERQLIRRAAGLGSFQAQTLETPYSGDTSDLDFYPDDL